VPDRLSSYRKKRELERTPEPDASRGSGSGDAPRFVIQEHDASTHHGDLRLEVEGTLRSRAVPRGPCTDPSEKRPAIPTEDHPLTYTDFEGVIPEDDYGAGAVIVWDAGTYENHTTDDDGDEVA